MSKQFANADGRPRIHIDADAQTDSCRWRIGPRGMDRHTKTAGQALDAALAQIGPQDAVIIFSITGKGLS